MQRYAFNSDSLAKYSPQRTRLAVLLRANALHTTWSAPTLASPLSFFCTLTHGIYAHLLKGKRCVLLQPSQSNARYHLLQTLVW